jgi:hypothetical protein
MKAVLWLLLGIVIGGFVGWYAHALGGGEVRAAARFDFSDRLANNPRPSLISLRRGRGEVLTWPTRSTRLRSCAKP